MQILQQNCSRTKIKIICSISSTNLICRIVEGTLLLERLVLCNVVYQAKNLNQLVCISNNGISRGSPGLVVMGRDSCSEGRGFEFQHRILDGHFHNYLL